jgi:tetratricopeptide (TPR) repeat protein
MTPSRPLFAALAVAAGLGVAPFPLFAPTAFAQATFAQEASSRAPAATPVAPQELKDAAVVREALEARTPADLARHMDALKTVMSHGPAVYPTIETRGDRTIVRSIDMAQGTALSLVASAAAVKAGQNKVNIELAFNTYPMAALLLGSNAVERRQPEEALRWLDRGLAWQPDNLYLVTEKGAALALQHRFADALALYEATLALNAINFDDASQARLLRSKGFALIELGRLNEAETAYEASLKLEPGHGGAQRELRYIAEQRDGAARQKPEIYTGAEAKVAK